MQVAIVATHEYNKSMKNDAEICAKSIVKRMGAGDVDSVIATGSNVKRKLPLAALLMSIASSLS
jgi:hypothetical protein